MADVDPRSPEGTFDAFFCPDCELGLIGVDGEPSLLHCPRCETYFELPLIARDSHREDELSSLRIRQLAVARRAAYRSRSYCVIGALVCVVAAVQLVWMAIMLIRADGFSLRAVAYFPVAALAVWGAGFFYGKAVVLDREAKQTSLPPATGEPDFTPLSDGSQQWKNLDEVR
jgi:hypothetical protein